MADIHIRAVVGGITGAVGGLFLGPVFGGIFLGVAYGGRGIYALAYLGGTVEGIGALLGFLIACPLGAFLGSRAKDSVWAFARGIGSAVCGGIFSGFLGALAAVSQINALVGRP
ncbi:MAG: hypothetical protein HY558_02030 [Euryarchaeota archaeon]|nr:hypothetical protein [Euryarchaeota archaeon]